MIPQNWIRTRFWMLLFKGDVGRGCSSFWHLRAPGSRPWAPVMVQKVLWWWHEQFTLEYNTVQISDPQVCYLYRSGLPGKEKVVGCDSRQMPVQILAVPHTSCAAQRKLLNFSEAQCAHKENGDDDIVFRRIFGRLKCSDGKCLAQCLMLTRCSERLSSLAWLLFLDRLFHTLVTPNIMTTHIISTPHTDPQEGSPESKTWPLQKEKTRTKRQK